jgi:tetratricopeptide (TPR) repeat protein
LGNIGLDYQYSGNFLLALEYHNKSLETIKANGLMNSGASLGNIALIYNGNGSHEKALEIQMKALKIAIDNNLPSYRTLCLANIGGVYYNLGNYKKALDYYNEAYNLALSLEMDLTAANCLSDIGNIKQFDNEHNEAITYYQKALEQYQKMDTKNNLAITNSNLCNSYSALNRNDEAIKAGEIALNNAVEIGNPVTKRLASESMYLAQYKRKEYDQALTYLSLLRKTIIEGIEINYYGLTEKERENYLLSLENDIGNYYDFGVLHQERYPSITDTMYNLALSNKGLSLKSSTYIRRSIMNSNDSVLISDYESFIANKKKIADNYAK